MFRYADIPAAQPNSPLKAPSGQFQAFKAATEDARSRLWADLIALE